MDSIQMICLCMIFAVVGGISMYQWLSVPRTQDEKNKMLKQGLVILIVVVTLLIVTPFVPEEYSRMIEKLGTKWGLPRIDGHGERSTIEVWRVHREDSKEVRC